MPRGEWTAKQERQYEHIRDSAREQGKSLDRAKEIARATSPPPLPTTPWAM